MVVTKSQPEKSFIEQLDALVDNRIDSMPPAQLKKFRRERKKIMKSATPRGSSSRVWSF
jgi:hypothetical protein